MISIKRKPDRILFCWIYCWSQKLACLLLTYILFMNVAFDLNLIVLEISCEVQNGPMFNNNTNQYNYGQHLNKKQYKQLEQQQLNNQASSRIRPIRSVYLTINRNYSSSIINESNTNWDSYNQASRKQLFNDQPPILDQCCACDEAKYELVFEGLWSRYTHPDDFPENYWLAHFSDIIGASHSNEFRMWNHDIIATEGVRELAETGSTKKLEAELKQVSSKTRTIIKARELRYPNLNSKTSAVFRTDRQHHLVSILSKLNPSPDWILGVSGLELCQSDCSWAIQRVVNLYLWDAGTDSGTTFTAPDSPTQPQERIHLHRKERQTKNNLYSTNSNDFNKQQSQVASEQNPTYSADTSVVNPTIDSTSTTLNNNNIASDQVKPYARLTITRQRIYEKSCNGNEQLQMPINKKNSFSNYSTMNTIEWAETTMPNIADCRYTDWSDWSSCSSNCGKGIRTRTRGFVDEQAHLSGCSQNNLMEKEICLSECIGNVTCVTRDWTDWSKCSVTCGQGIRKKTRSPIGQMKKACGRIELTQTEVCIASHNVDCSSVESHGCEVSDWSQWSKCSVACGKGTRIRTRKYLIKDGIEHCNATLIQKSSCIGRLESCQDSRPNERYLMHTCLKPVDPGPCRALIQRWHYDKSLGTCSRFSFGGCLGNANNFETFQDCERNCLMAMNVGQDMVMTHNPNLPVIDCKLSSWSPWSTCSAMCGEGKRTRSRYIVQMPQNGGKPCDKKLSRTQKCKDLPPCPPNYKS